MNCAISALSTLSSSLPKRIEKSDFSVIEITKSLSDFLIENFRGLAEVRSDIEYPGSVALSPEHFAYLIKLILKQINGEIFLTFNISCDRNAFTVEIPFERKIFISVNEQTNLRSAAAGAGLDINLFSDKITIFAKCSAKFPSVFVYAGGMQKLRLSLFNIFFGI